jgi:hypothetical protein
MPHPNAATMIRSHTLEVTVMSAIEPGGRPQQL